MNINTLLLTAMFVFLGIAVFMFLIVAFKKLKDAHDANLKKNSLLNDINKWESNDIIVLKSNTSIGKVAMKYHKSCWVRLVKWNREICLIQMWNADEVERYFVTHAEIELNRSFQQRKWQQEMSQYMVNNGKREHEITSENNPSENSSFGKSPKQPLDKNLDAKIRLFYDEYEILPTENGTTIKGKLVSKLNETELKVYLKLSLENDAFELCQEIENALKKFQE